MALSMLVLGCGIGLCMQVLTIIVQNTVAYRDLGVPTSGVTFFRTLGSSFGAAIFGAVVANVLGHHLPQAAARSGLDAAFLATPSALHSQPAAQISPVVDAHAIHVVFLAAVPVALAAFVLALFLKEVPMRGTSRAGAVDVGDGFGMPDGADSAARLQVAIARLFRSKGRQALPAVRAASGTTLEVSDGWCVGQVHLRERLGADSSLAAISRWVRVPAEVLHPAFQAARDNGYLTGDDAHLALTDAGHREIAAFVAAIRQWLATELADWGADDSVALDQALEQMARRFVDEAPSSAGHRPWLATVGADPFRRGRAPRPDPAAAGATARPAPAWGRSPAAAGPPRRFPSRGSRPASSGWRWPRRRTS
jgi:hypothetical protein